MKYYAKMRIYGRQGWGPPEYASISYFKAQGIKPKIGRKRRYPLNELRKYIMLNRCFNERKYSFKILN